VLQSKLELREQLRSKFRLILVNEFEDVDPAQFQLLQLLAPPESSPRLVVVGDPAQSIYGFRGTVPRLLGVDFPTIYGAATVGLDECWRCSQEVLEAGERLLGATQPGRAHRSLRSVAQLTPPNVVVAHEGDGLDEAFFCAREIKRIHTAFPALRHDHFAIPLPRTTAMGAPFEEALRALGLPYEVRG